MTTEITEQQALDRFRARLGWVASRWFSGSAVSPRRKLAAEFGVSSTFISMVLRGDRKLTAPMLASVGVERVTVYRLKSGPP